MKLIISIPVAIMLVATQAMAGTTYKATVPPLVDFCDSGTCDFYGSVSCTTNADCNFGSLSNKSKASLTGAGLFKVQLKGVVDAAGAPASGDYMLFLHPFGTTIDELLPIRITVVDGKGKAQADLSTLLPPAGEAVTLVNASDLLTPPTVPADCPGAGNSAADISARVGDADCATGQIIGKVGVTAGSTSAVKTNFPPIADSCDSGNCVWNYNETCSTNSDCNFGSLSAKSKVSLTGAGALKLKVKDVMDATGNPGAGDYILFMLIDSQTTFRRVFVKVTVAGGEGEADVDLSTFMGPPGEAVSIFNSGLYNPLPVPADCPGTNSAADISAREFDPDCGSEGALGLMGILTQ